LRFQNFFRSWCFQFFFWSGVSKFLSWCFQIFELVFLKIFSGVGVFVF
jgi:hypothetical protein